MLISKTAFKEYAKCNRKYPLEQIYFKKLDSNISFFNDEKIEKTLEILSLMFDDESGDDILTTANPQLEALLPYYNLVEEYAIRIARNKFNLPFEYYETTHDQQCFSYQDPSGHTFYCYLDGYGEGEDEVLVIEVKATTSKKFKELGPKRKVPIGDEKYNSIFELEDNIFHLKTKIDGELTLTKFQQNYQKLFDIYSNVGKYVFDIAVERYIIEQSIRQNHPKLQKKKFKYYLAVLNSDYVFDGKYVDEQPQYSNDLISFVDLTKVSQEYLKLIDQMKNDIVETILNKSLEAPTIGEKCAINKANKCLFCNICWSKLLEKGSILEYIHGRSFTDLAGIRHEKYDLINQGYFKMKDIPQFWLTNPNQIIQRRCLENNEEYLNLEKLVKGIELIEYPIYHLDFESFPCPLPRFKGEKPYSQSLFQYSIHIEHQPGQCNQIDDHYSFLVNDFSDHRNELVEGLIKTINLKNGGTVLVYNKSFEYNRIKELITIFPEYQKHLKKILEKMFDLMDVIKTKSSIYQQLGFSEEDSKTINYYHNDLQGLYSIKKVLPLFSDLSYNDLSVKNGTEAIVAYASFKNLAKEDIEKLREDLIVYCRQDTWAMVVILNNLIKKINEKKSEA